MKIKENKIGILAGMLACMMSVGCEKVDLGDIEAVTAEQELISMEEVAQLLSCVQLGTDQIQEVYDAVSASQENGYDEEYMLADLLSAPGRGVGEEKLKSSVFWNSVGGNSTRSNSAGGNSTVGAQTEGNSTVGSQPGPRKTYSRPLKALFEDYCAYKAVGGTKGGAAAAWEGFGAAFRAENAAKSARSGSGTAFRAENPAKSARSGSGTAFRAENPAKSARSGSGTAFRAENPTKSARSGSGAAFRAENPAKSARSGSGAAFRAENPTKSARSGSGAAFRAENAAKSARSGSGTAFRAENPAKSARSGSGEITAEDYLRYLEQSGMQIYWPESQSWDGTTAPVVTFAPQDESARSNVGWYMGPDGNVDTLTVTEAMAQSRPVWVINRNDDSPFVSLEVMRKNNPDWETGGNIQIIPSAARGTTLCSTRGIHPSSARESHPSSARESHPSSARGTTQSSMLLLKSFKMLRHYDNWFRGGSEFMIRIGAINSFTASTEAELKLYNPEVTEFMVSVKRKELNVEKQLGVIMVSDWTEQLEDCAFMVTEDDGGTQTSWKCSGTVKINSKSYGFEVTIPLNSYDDIVWRGKLSRKYLRSSPTITGRFGDTEITFATETY